CQEVYRVQKFQHPRRGESTKRKVHQTFPHPIRIHEFSPTGGRRITFILGRFASKSTSKAAAPPRTINWTVVQGRGGKGFWKAKRWPNGEIRTPIQKEILRHDFGTFVDDLPSGSTPTTHRPPLIDAVVPSVVNHTV